MTLSGGRNDVRRANRHLLRPIATPRHSHTRGLTYIEVLVSITISLIIIAAGASAYIRISQAVAEARAYSDATMNASVALRNMTFDIKEAQTNPGVGGRMFLGYDVQGTRGNDLDDDGDTLIDEDRPDGIDEDGAYTEQHATIGLKVERPNFLMIADIGDAGLDDDPVWDLDTLEFRVHPGPTPRNERVLFSVGTFEGEDNVLVRERETNPGSAASTTTIEPIAYDVLGLNILYWDPNLDTPYWVPQWDATTGPFPGPDFRIPASVYLEITVYAGAIPLDMLGPSDSREVVTLATVVNIESIITNPRYDNFVRPPS